MQRRRATIRLDPQALVSEIPEQSLILDQHALVQGPLQLAIIDELPVEGIFEPVREKLFIQGSPGITRAGWLVATSVCRTAFLDLLSELEQRSHREVKDAQCIGRSGFSPPPPYTNEVISLGDRDVCRGQPGWFRRIGRGVSGL